MMNYENELKQARAQLRHWAERYEAAVRRGRKKRIRTFAKKAQIAANKIRELKEG